MIKSKSFALALFSLLTLSLFSQSTINYSISFENALHHEGKVSIEFKELSSDTLSLRMSRSSPGRYAIHEFAKNVYNVTAKDETGKDLLILRPNPYQWDISGYKGYAKVSYTLFANHADGTYSQIDETHAHLNIPATFMYAPSLEKSPIQIEFEPRTDLNWKVATQLKKLSNHIYYAPNLAYFMDSPVEISDHSIKSFKTSSKGKEFEIKFVLHQNDDYQGFDTYFENVKKIVEAEKDVFHELPEFDFGSYVFLACYLPHVAGDGMEHRNSTILTSQNALKNGGADQNISTVAHEFFHAWNVERIRPASLEPFDFSEANISGELWFAEGFTSYYTSLILCRTGIISKEKYAADLSGPLNYVWNSPARTYYNPIEMSYQAPFVDAATSIDQVNWDNIFISYYTYGKVLGLALDLSLRNLKENKSLDGFMKLIWEQYGKNEIPYTIENLQDGLTEYSSKSFSEHFFENFIFSSEMPDYKTLLASVGIEFSYRFEDRPTLGANVQKVDNKWLINSYPLEGSSLYLAGLSKGDKIISIDGKLTNNKLSPEDFIKQYKIGDTLKVVFSRHGENKESLMTITKDHSYKTQLMEKVAKDIKQRQNAWLNKLEN